MTYMKSDLADIEDDLFSYSAPVEERPLSLAPSEEIECEHGIMERLKKGLLEEGNRFHCRTESHILQLAYAYNKILSLSNSRTRILATSGESTHRIVNSLNQRFLIADEVGLGKTIEAGLVIKELIYRYDYRRILIACPASLIYQWQSEMKSKFNEHFDIMTGSYEEGP
jgi:SNF2 family DNA or RNA helicase